MFEILTVCTGNICRSPLAEHMLRVRLGGFAPVVSSAGTYGLAAQPMTAEAIALAVAAGVREQDAASHRSRLLEESHLNAPDLILTMTRDHRRAVVELAPARLRSTFTIREFARLAASLSDDDLGRAAHEAGDDSAARVRAAVSTVAAQRGVAAQPADPADDDVVDPYGRSWQTYQRAAAQLEPAVDVVVRTLSIALEGNGRPAGAAAASASAADAARPLVRRDLRSRT